MMKRINRRRKSFCIWLLLDFVISFMAGIFAPIDIYYANQDEFWFSLWQMLSVCFLVFLFTFAILLLLSWILNRFSVSPYIHFAFFVILLFFYIQGNYIPRNYGVLNGGEILWDQYPGYALASIIVFVTCIILYAFVCFKFRDKIPVIIKSGCIFLLGIQLLTISVLVVKNSKKAIDQNNIIVTTKGQFEFSSNNNIVVFLLDKFGAQDFQALLAENNEKYAEVFTGFTFYPDCLGAYPSTKCSVPYILTGEWYENEEPFVDYLRKAYDNNPVYSALAENDYRLHVFTSEDYLSSDDGFYTNVETGQYVIKDVTSFISTFYRLVAFNYMPHQAKQIFISDSNVFLPFRKTQSSDEPYSEDVLSFYDQYDQEGITINAEGNIFAFYHLEGVHDPFTFDENLQTNEGSTRLDEAKGNVTLLKRIFQDFESKGIFDTSTIVVMSDHGSEGYYQNPLFMIKNQNERHPFSVSDEKMSWEYLEKIWLSFANGEAVNESFFSTQDSNISQRRFLYYNWDDAWDRSFMPGMEEYYCSGSAQNPDNLIPTGRSFYAKEEDHSYNMGSILDFVSERSGYMHCLYGIAYDDMICAGRVMQKAGLQFQLSERKDQNVLLSLSTNDHCGTGVFSLFANSNLIAEYTYRPSSIYHFVIPYEFINADNSLLLEIDQTNGEDNVNAKTINTGLLINSIQLADTSSKFHMQDQMNDYHYDLGTIIEFSEKNNVGSNYILSGFSQAEENGTWMIGKTSKLKYEIDPQIVHDEVELVIDCLPFGDKQKIITIVNGYNVDEYIVDKEESRSIYFSKDIIDKDGMLQITIKHPDACLPKSLGMSEDTRELALFLKSICIR